MVYSASAAMADLKFGNPYLFLVKQGMWAALGIAIMSIVMRVDYRVWRQPMLIWTAIGFAFWRWSRCCSARRSTARVGGSASTGSASSLPRSPSSP